MVNFKKTLTKQQQIDEAVKGVSNLLNAEFGYDELIETMSNAQTAIMVMTTHYHRLLEQFPEEDDNVYHEDITEFLWMVSEVCKVIKPFAEIIGKINPERVS